MVKYLIVEDEKLAADEICRMIQALRTDYTATGIAESVVQAIEHIRRNKTDLIIMDIQLSDGMCFEIFEHCPTDIPIIFTTAYDEYAIKAFKVNSIDYLLKPIEESELDVALRKFEQRAALNAATPEYIRLRDTYLARGRKNRFLVQTGDTYKYVTTDDIAFFYSEDKYTYLLSFARRHYIVGHSLDNLQNMLDPHMFFRVSRNCIANIGAIERSSRHFGGRLKLHFKPECPVAAIVSRSRADEFLAWLDDAQ